MSSLHESVIGVDATTRPTYLEIDLSILESNYQAIQSAVQNTKVMPILKANAYGHGLLAVATRLARAGADYFGVAYLEEGIYLRQHGIQTPILVMGGIVGSQIPLFLEYDLTLTASSVEKLLAIEACALAMKKRAKVHLKIDTGMERIGIHWYSATKLLEATLPLKAVDVEGIFSHFANADSTDMTYSRMQLTRFQEVLDWYHQRSLAMPLRHIANSGAILQLPESYFDMVRPGILLYGAPPSSSVAKTIPVQQALTWKSRVVYFKVVKAGFPVSYGSCWQPTTDTRVITLPVGYGDGYHRAMSGKVQILLKNKRYPVVGRICMDQIMIDIGQDSAYNGDEVVLLGGSGPQAITIEEFASWMGSIPHEALTSINTRVPRIYIN